MRERCDTAQEGAKEGLFALMTGISEENWCAGWMDGLERSLWNIKPGEAYGMNVVTERQVALLHLLAEEAEGWWTYTNMGEKFVPLDEWRASLRAAEARDREEKARD